MAVNPYGKRSGSDLSRTQDLISTFNKKSGEIKNITVGDIMDQWGPSPYGGLYTKIESGPAVTNTTVESPITNGNGIGTLSVPAYNFKVGDTYKAFLSGTLTCLNNTGLEIHVRAINGVNIILSDSGLLTLSGATNKDWELQIWFTVRSIGPAGVASIYTSGKFLYSKDANASPERISFSTQNNTTFDTTTDLTLQVNVQWGVASTSNSIISEQFVLSKLF